MKKLIWATVVAFVVIAAPAFAQSGAWTGPPTEQPGPPKMSQAGQQTQMSATGKISEIDLAQGTLTLDDGTQFTLPPNFQYTSFPAVGQEVEVIYDDQGGQKVARSLDQGFQGKSNE
jgi:hypothetical protein